MSSTSFKEMPQPPFAYRRKVSAIPFMGTLACIAPGSCNGNHLHRAIY